MSENAKHALDGISLAAAFGAFVTWLPPLAAFASLVWSLLRIYETKTVQSWLKRRNRK